MIVKNRRVKLKEQNSVPFKAAKKRITENIIKI